MVKRETSKGPTSRRSRRYGYLWHSLAQFAFISTFAWNFAHSAADTNDILTAEDMPAAIDFIVNTEFELRNMIDKYSDSHSDLIDRLTEKANEKLAISQMVKFVLGRNYRTLTLDQISTFTQLYSRLWATQFVRFLSGKTIKDHKIKNQTIFRNSIVITSTIYLDKKYTVNWIVRKLDGMFKVIHIYVDRISMSVTQRSEYADIIKEYGFSTLLKRLNCSISKRNINEDDPIADFCYKVQ